MASSDSDDGVKVKEEPPSTTSDSAATIQSTSIEPRGGESSSQPHTSAVPASDARIDQPSAIATAGNTQQLSERLATQIAPALAALNQIQSELLAAPHGQTSQIQSTLPNTETGTASFSVSSLRERLTNTQAGAQAWSAILSRSDGRNDVESSAMAARARDSPWNEVVINRATASHQGTPAASNGRNRSASPASRRQQYRSRTPPRGTGSRRQNACQHCGRRHAGECWTCSHCDGRGHTANTCTNPGRTNALSAPAPLSLADINEFLQIYVQAYGTMAAAVSNLFSDTQLPTATSASVTLSRDEVMEFWQTYSQVQRIVLAAFFRLVMRPDWLDHF